MVSLEGIAQDGLTHGLRVEIAAQDGQFGKNGSENGLTHQLVEIAVQEDQFGNSSEDG
jgi:hypothetical protein